MERFFDTTNDPDTQDAVLTPTAFNNRLNKASLAIRNVLRMPDILGVEEMENLTTLQAWRARSTPTRSRPATAEPELRRLPRRRQRHRRHRRRASSSRQPGQRHRRDAGRQGRDLHRPEQRAARAPERPAAARAARDGPRRPPGAPFPVTVIVNHLRSLNGVDDPVDGNRVRTKRRAQAEFLANLIQARQTADPDEHIVSIGDYNAFQFNDGYVDVDRHDQRDADAVRPGRALLERPRQPRPGRPRGHGAGGRALLLRLRRQRAGARPRARHAEPAVALRRAPLRAQRRGLPRVFPQRSRTVPSASPTTTLPVAYFRLPLLSALSPANVWVGLKDRAGLKNSADVSIRFDLRAEIYYNGSTLVGSGELAERHRRRQRVPQREARLDPLEPPDGRRHRAGRHALHQGPRPQRLLGQRRGLRHRAALVQRHRGRQPL